MTANTRFCNCGYEFVFANRIVETEDEPPLGVIREQGEWPLRPDGARSMT